MEEVILLINIFEELSKNMDGITLYMKFYFQDYQKRKLKLKKLN